MTDEQKAQAYRDGDYAFEARYLCGRHDLWTVAEWVRFIDTHGRWGKSCLDLMGS